MADHAKPILTDNYTDVLSQIRGRFEDQAKGFDPANTAATNIATGTIRWTSASNKWQKWSGTAWTDLSSLYAINISGNAATATNANTVTNGVYTVGDQTIAGVKTFSSTIQGSISGNAGTVTNGVYTTGDQTINGVKTFNSNTIFNGNLGIGTSSPRGLLDLNTTRGVKAYFGTAGTFGETQNTAGDYVANNLFVSAESAGVMTYTKTTGDNGNAIIQDFSRGITFYTGVTGASTTTGTLNTFERMRLDANGNLGVGTSSPASKLAVSGGGVTIGGFQPGAGSTLELGFDGTQAIVQGFNRASSSYLPVWIESSLTRFGTGGSERMRLDANGKLILSAANQGIQFADGTTQTTAAINPATAAVGAIGTMAMCKYTGTGSVSFGGTKNASELQYSDVTGSVVTATVDGNTWRCLGRCSDAGNAQRVTIWVRVS